MHVYGSGVVRNSGTTSRSSARTCTDTMVSTISSYHSATSAVPDCAATSFPNANSHVKALSPAIRLRYPDADPYRAEVAAAGLSRGSGW